MRRWHCKKQRLLIHSVTFAQRNVVICRRVVEEISRDTPVSMSHIPRTTDLIQFRNNPRKKEKKIRNRANKFNPRGGKSGCLSRNNIRTAPYNKRSKTVECVVSSIIDACKILFSFFLLLKIDRNIERKFFRRAISRFTFGETLKFRGMFSNNRYFNRRDPL